MHVTAGERDSGLLRRSRRSAASHSMSKALVTALVMTPVLGLLGTAQHGLCTDPVWLCLYLPYVYISFVGLCPEPHLDLLVFGFRYTLVYLLLYKYLTWSLGSAFVSHVHPLDLQPLHLCARLT